MSDFRFQLGECQRAIVSIAGLVAGDELVLWRKACDGKCPGDDDEVFIEFSPNNCANIVSPTQNPLLVDVPGMYELRFAGAVNPDARMCVDIYSRNCATA